MNKISCTMENAPRFMEWCKTRGGVALWQSADLSNPGQTWSTPALTAEGKPMEKQHWSMQDKPVLIESNPENITVFVDEEVGRFRVAIRRGSQGFTFKCTDASSRKVRAAVSRAGENAYHTFDYETQEAVIMRPAKEMSLAAWAEQQSVPV